MERLSTLTQAKTDQAALEDLCKYLQCCAFTRSNDTRTMALFLERHPDALHAKLIRQHLEVQTKAAVPPGTTTDADWATPLNSKPLVAPLLSLAQDQALLARVGFRKGPFNAEIPAQVATGTYTWIGQGLPKPVTKLGFETLRLSAGKIQGIIALTQEVLKLDPGADNTMRDALTAGLVQFQDQQLLDPAVAAVADKNPASITNGVTPTTSTGDLDADVAAVLAALYTSRPGSARPILIMSPVNAGTLAAAGEHPQLTVGGGTAFGVPVYTSVGAGPHVVAVDASAVVYADGGLVLDLSGQVAIEMVDTPAVPTATTVLTSFWQMGLVGFKVERFLWWTKAAGSVALLTTS